MSTASLYTITDARLEETLDFVNALRRHGRGNHMPGALDAAERMVSVLFDAEKRLAVYGSLIPGKENHHVVSPIVGTWTTGYFQGDFFDRGWAAGIGYPAARWRTGGSRIAVHVLTAPALPEHWSLLDDFEGSDYQRILVPVFSDSGRILVCNLYELHADTD